MKRILFLLLSILVANTIFAGSPWDIKVSKKVDNIKPSMWDILLYKRANTSYVTCPGVEIIGGYILNNGTVLRAWIYLNPNQASTTHYQKATLQFYCRYRKRVGMGWPPTYTTEWGYKTWTATVAPNNYEGWTDWTLNDEEYFNTEYWYPYDEVVSSDVTCLSLVTE